MTLQQIAQDTKIAPRHLTALEQGNVKSLPGGMYRRAMLRAYADSVGLDKEAALEHFERTFEPPPRTAPGGRQPLADVVARGSSHERPRTAARCDGAGLTAVAATVTVDPAPPVAARSARSKRGRDRGVLLAVIVASALGVVGLVTGDRRDTRQTATGIAPAGSVAVDEPSTRPTPAAAGPIAAAPSVAIASAVDRPRTEPSPPSASAVVARVADAALPVAPPAVSRTSADAAGTAPPPIARATTGQLVIATTPPGARVTVNGTGWGVSPVTVRHLPFGSKRIRVTHDGYASQERVITLSTDRPNATVSLDLSPRE